MVQLGVIGGTDPALTGPDAPPLHDALNAIAAAAHAAITGHGFGLPATSRAPALAEHLASQPGHGHARRRAATLTMTTTASLAPRTATP